MCAKEFTQTVNWGLQPTRLDENNDNKQHLGDVTVTSLRDPDDGPYLIR